MSDEQRTERARVLRDLAEVRGDLEAIRDAMQTAYEVSFEDAGIAFVCSEAALEIVNRLELDLIADEIPAEYESRRRTGAAS